MKEKKQKRKYIIRRYIALLILFMFLGVVIYSVNSILNRYDSYSNPEEISYSKDTHDNKNNDKNEKLYTITSVGNLIVHDAQISGAKQTSEDYNFDKSFEYIKDAIYNSDLSIGVFEGTFNGGKPQGYPTFNSPDEFLDTLKSTGFDIINYASNHIIDKGSSGVKNTITKSINKNLINIGVKRDNQDKNYIIYEIDGHKIGMFAYTYKTGPNTINGIQIPKDVYSLINTFDYNNLSTLYNDVESSIKDMKKEGVEFIIGSFHWGEEYVAKENNTQKNIARKMNELGVDVVLGGHPHVIQPYEILTSDSGHSTFIAYSQGNFLSNQCYEEIQKNLTEDGLLIKFTLGLRNNKLYLKNYDITPTWVYREPKDNGLFIHRIIPVVDALNNSSKYKLSSNSINKLNRSLNDTKRIIGSDSLGTKSFP
ncbi:hypothetical protein UT300003_08550 [Clostridium sardiniense]